MSSGHTSGPWKRREWRQDAWIAIVTVATGLALVLLVNQTSLEDLWKRGVTRLYMPFLTPIYANTGQDLITVVTIDDTDLDEFDTPWPIKLDFLSRRLRAMFPPDKEPVSQDGIRRGPSAVFIDLFLLASSTPNEIEALRSLVCARAHTTRFYLATVGEPSRYSDAEKILFGATRVMAKNSEPIHCVTPVAVPVEPDELDQLQWQYPMTGRLIPNATPRPTAAAAIFCGRFPKQCVEDMTQPLALIWPATSFSSNVETMIRRKETAPSPDSGGVQRPIEFEATCRDGRFWQIPWAFLWTRLKFLHLDGDDREHKLKPCPYNRVLPLRAFNGRGFSDAEMSEAIDGKIVLLGAHIYGGGDAVVSPINGSLPGIHSHAVALDNLISFEGRYKLHVEFDEGHLWDDNHLFIGISIACIVVVLTVWRHYFTMIPERVSTPDGDLDSRQLGFQRLKLIAFSIPMLFKGKSPLRSAVDPRSVFLGRLGLVVVYFVLSGTLFMLGYMVFRQGPLSMVEYVLFPLFADFIDLGDPLACRLQAWGRAMKSRNPVKRWDEEMVALKKEAEEAEEK